MAREHDTARDPQGRQRPVGLGPDAGGEEDPGMVPPYEGRTTGTHDSPSNEALAGTIERQLAETDPGRPGATTSPAQESPVRREEVARGARGAGQQSATDPTAASPMGVGESTTGRGEDIAREEGEEPGRTDLGTKGRSERPVGTSDQRSSTGVDSQDLAEEGMPSTQTGDQGG